VATGLRNTSGQQGYAANQNAFQAFEAHDDSSVDTTVTNIAPTAITTGSTLGQMYQAATVPDELAAAIRTITDNQHAFYQHITPLSQQMAVLSHHDTQRQSYPPPTINQLHVPAFRAPAVARVAQPNGYQGSRVAQPGGYQQGRRGNTVAQPGGYNNGRGYGRGRGRCGRRSNRGGCGCTGFADYVPSGRGGSYSAMGGNNTHRPFQSNLVKAHNNWNVCYSCGFDVEDGNNSITCRMDWRKPGHDVYFTRANAQQKLDAGCNACTQGMHKSILPVLA
jgi:hypothetical protein